MARETILLLLSFTISFHDVTAFLWVLVSTKIDLAVDCRLQSFPVLQTAHTRREQVELRRLSGL